MVGYYWSFDWIESIYYWTCVSSLLMYVYFTIPHQLVTVNFWQQIQIKFFWEKHSIYKMSFVTFLTVFIVFHRQASTLYSWHYLVLSVLSVWQLDSSGKGVLYKWYTNVHRSLILLVFVCHCRSVLFVLFAVIFVCLMC